jgi:hypothetical protein
MVLDGQQNGPCEPLLHMRSLGQHPPQSVFITPPLAQQVLVSRSHSPSTQQVSPHANSVLQQVADLGV